MLNTEAAIAPEPPAVKPPWSVPFGFATSELTQTFEGPIIGGDGQAVEYGPLIYDDGAVRIVVRPGDRETYSATGYYMSIESLAGEPGQHFSNVHAALAAAAAELRAWPHYRHALSAAGGAS